MFYKLRRETTVFDQFILIPRGTENEESATHMLLSRNQLKRWEEFIQSEHGRGRTQRARTKNNLLSTQLRRNPLGGWVAPGQKSHNALHFYLWNETKRKPDSWFVKETQK